MKEMELALLSKVESDHAESVAWAREKLSSTEWLILDTETTGLSTITSRVVEIAVLEPSGNVLLETLVNPETEIPEGASRIHGISNLDVVNSPTMTEVWPELLATVENRLLLCYNVNYDKPLLANEAARRGLTPIDSTWQCVMLRYAAFVGEPGYGGYRYQKLPSAGHRAKDDCLATIELIHKMAAN
ncbi:MAG: 3'-5' exonuclease [Acidimicrobiaceae bacterium]|nr:3'-5' exonuclease [Acidimicrobiaceae bacterium]